LSAGARHSRRARRPPRPHGGRARLGALQSRMMFPTAPRRAGPAGEHRHIAVGRDLADRDTAHGWRGSSWL
jgi:hypothetical protein